MATFITGEIHINIPRKSSSRWEMVLHGHDDARGPHIAFQYGGALIYIVPTIAEVQALYDFCKVVLKKDGD